jgi:hypothetical protein
MNASATDLRHRSLEPRVRAGVRRGRTTHLRAAPEPARPGRRPHRDDGSHTPPHGDAVLRRRIS